MRHVARCGSVPQAQQLDAIGWTSQKWVEPSSVQPLQLLSRLSHFSGLIAPPMMFDSAVESPASFAVL